MAEHQGLAEQNPLIDDVGAPQQAAADLERGADASARGWRSSWRLRTTAAALALTAIATVALWKSSGAPRSSAPSPAPPDPPGGARNQYRTLGLDQELLELEEEGGDQELPQAPAPPDGAHNKYRTLGLNHKLLKLEDEDGDQELPHPVAGGGLAWVPPAEPRGLLSDCEGTCGRICGPMRKVLAKYKVRPASEAPSDFGLDLTFYTKYINVMGVPVLSSNKLCDCVLQKAAWIVHGTISHLKHRSEVLEKMRANRHRLAIMAKEEKTTDVPEHSDLTPKDNWDHRSRGLGGTPYRPASSGAEESVMCESWATNGYFGENILLHEFTHGIARTGFKFMSWEDGLDWDDLNGRVYEHAKSAGLWKNTYAITNKIEYFAEAVQSWFSTNLQAGACKHDRQSADGIHNCIDTHKELRHYDPQLYEHLVKLFHKDAWTPGVGDACGCASPAAMVDGFVALTADGSVDGGDANDDHATSAPPAGGVGDGDDEPPEVPVPPEDCLGEAIEPLCKQLKGCTWDRATSVCRHDCAALQAESSCWLTGVCSWMEEEQAGVCHRGDSDSCLAEADDWGSHHKCATSKKWCASWSKDMQRCCPGTCGTQPVCDVAACSALPGKGTCKFPTTQGAQQCHDCLPHDDEHEHCQSWAEMGECDRNPGFMRTSCELSCTDDGHRHCKDWASNGQCFSNPGYMLQSCPMSCSCKNLKRAQTE